MFPRVKPAIVAAVVDRLRNGVARGGRFVPAGTAARLRSVRVMVRSGVGLNVVDHAYPAPLIELWTRPDLGCAFMCGWPLVRGVADVVAVAVPVLADARTAGRPVYWTDVVVRADSTARGIGDLQSQRVAYTVRDSRSGFNALCHHLQGSPGAKPLLGAEVGPVFTPRRARATVVDRRAETAPVDSIAHALLQLHDPGLAAQVRVIAPTEAMAAPLLVASAGVDPGAVRALRTALPGLHQDVDGRAILSSLALRRITEPHAQCGVPRDGGPGARRGRGRHHTARTHSKLLGMVPCPTLPCRRSMSTSSTASISRSSG